MQSKFANKLWRHHDNLQGIIQQDIALDRNHYVYRIVERYRRRRYDHCLLACHLGAPRQSRYIAGWQRHGGDTSRVAGEAVPLGGFSYRQKGSGNLD